MIRLTVRTETASQNWPRKPCGLPGAAGGPELAAEAPRGCTPFFRRVRSS
jgi:hypothetical protein